MSAILKELYGGTSDRAVNFRYGLVAFDLVTVLFVIVTSFFERSTWIFVLDLIFGTVILLDFIARAWIEDHRLRAMLRLTTWADIAAIISFLAPVVTGQALAFLRVLRTMRLLRSYDLLYRLRKDSKWFREREDIILAVTNLIVFLFVMTGLIYASQVNVNDQINNYADAFYFTVTTLTTVRPFSLFSRQKYPWRAGAAPLRIGPAQPGRSIPSYKRKRARLSTPSHQLIKKDQSRVFA
jgi:voltage-gated potassium channel